MGVQQMPKTLQAMFYPKNVPNIERLIRIVAGIALVVLAFILQATISRAGVVLSIVTAAFMIGTAFIGWCPMCALVGRKIKKNG
jgi:hypothetical protein